MFAEEKLKERNSALQMEELRLLAPSSSSKHSNDVFTMNDRYRTAITKLEGEKTKLNDELEKVIFTPPSDNTKNSLTNTFLNFP